MTTSKPVFVYGATGYTGRLVCEQLAIRGVPFAVGGRNADKLDAWCYDLQPADVEPVVVSHNIAALTEAFRGAKVVVNCTGPFGLLGMDVVEASLNAGCHYLDTTGEQDFMLDVRDAFSRRAEQEQRVIVTANSWYYALGACASEVCLRTEGIDTLSILYTPRGKPTLASMQSLFRTAARPGFHLENQELVPNTFAAVAVQPPGCMDVQEGMSAPTGEVAYYLGDPRVRSVKGVIITEVKHLHRVFTAWLGVTKVLGSRADRLGDSLVQRFYKSPPPENRAATRFVVAVEGHGERSRVSCEIYGSAPYIVTGFVGAEVAQRLVEGKIERYGFTSSPQAVGTAQLLEALKQVGVTTTTSDLITGQRTSL